MLGCVMEQGGEKEKPCKSCLPPLHTKGSSSRDLCSAWFTKKEKHTVPTPRAAGLPLGAAPQALGLPRSPKHLPHSPPSCQAAAMTCPDTTTLGKAVPMSHKNTARKSPSPGAPERLRASTARAAQNRPDTGPVRDAGRPEQPLLLLSHAGTIQKHNQKYFTVKDFKVQLLKSSAC